MGTPTYVKRGVQLPTYVKRGSATSRTLLEDDGRLGYVAGAERASGASGGSTGFIPLALPRIALRRIWLKLLIRLVPCRRAPLLFCLCLFLVACMPIPPLQATDVMRDTMNPNPLTI